MSSFKPYLIIIFILLFQSCADVGLLKVKIEISNGVPYAEWQEEETLRYVEIFDTVSQQRVWEVNILKVDQRENIPPVKLKRIEYGQVENIPSAAVIVSAQRLLEGRMYLFTANFGGRFFSEYFQIEDGKIFLIN